MMLNSILTLSDGQEPALWHRLCVKTNPASAALALTEQGDYGRTLLVNSELLNLNGATRYANWNEAIVALCGILMAIIMVGAVSLIYSAFSISVSERTKQFGLLSSVGGNAEADPPLGSVGSCCGVSIGDPNWTSGRLWGHRRYVALRGTILDSLFSFSANGIHIVAEVSPGVLPCCGRRFLLYGVPLGLDSCPSGYARFRPGGNPAERGYQSFPGRRRSAK